VLPAAAFLIAGVAVSAAPSAPADELHSQLLALRRRSEGIRPGTPEARPVAAELARIGRAYLEQGDTGRAVELLEEAYGWDEQNGLVLALLTLAYVRRSEFPFARFYLDLAEQRAPRAPPQAYEILGEVYYSLNRLEDAVAAWEHFQRLGGDSAATLRRLSKVRQELALASGQRHLETESFSFFWDPAIPASIVESVAERLAAIYREQSGFFATELPAPQIVILYAGRSYFSLVSVPEWVSGVFDGKIRVSLDPDGGLTEELIAVLSHELAHSFIRHVSADRAPGWLHEGLAQWWEGKRIRVSEIRGEFRGHAPYSLGEMEGNLARRSDRAAARSNYVQALAIVEYFFERHGGGTVACLTRDLGEGKTFAEALKIETGLTPDELFRSWKAWARLSARP
jgi:tetratricopeptide (TPR) repeat protein